MLIILGYLVLISIGIVLAKLLFSFVIAFFTYTITALMCGGTISFFLGITGILESDTAWTVFGCAMGIGFVSDVIKFLKDPGAVFSETKRAFQTPSDTRNYSGSSSSSDDTDYRYQGDQYRRCCGSCRWFSSNTSSYSVCHLSGVEMSHIDNCSDWQPG